MNKTHGKTYTREHRAWRNLRHRVRGANGPDYANYGGRGIDVCARWDSFENFLADMGECPDGMSLDRIDNDGDYSPDNCRWATRKQQNTNKRGCHWIEFDGQRRTISQWSEISGISEARILWRLTKGWPVEHVLNVPHRKWIRKELRPQL